jgi:mannose-6-phosphate isomerase
VFKIVNTPRDYSWGSTTAIAAVLGTKPTGRPEAELWLGDHPANPARVKDTGESLNDWATAHPERFGQRPLPFLLKLLAAESPLSIQAHPTPAQARAGFDRENAAGIPVDSPVRNYRDANHKPEIIIALTEFSALCGFRPGPDRDRILDALERVGVANIAHLRAHVTNGLDSAVQWILEGDADVLALVDSLSTVAASTGDALVDDALAVTRSLAEHFPGDVGVAVSILLNHVVLSPGEALFLPAGNVHAYLHGLGIEVMATSDNVLRGGLTPKHIDIPELLSILDFTELVEPRITPDVHGSVRTFRPPVDDFAVTDVELAGEADVAIHGPAIAVVTSGQVELRPGGMTANRGDAVFIEAMESITSVAGQGRLFVASRP